jgi:pyruvate-formate lyase
MSSVNNNKGKNPLTRRDFIRTVSQSAIIIYAAPTLLQSCAENNQGKSRLKPRELDINEEVKLYGQFTETYKKYKDNHGLREVECMRIQYPIWLRSIEAGDRFAGRGEFDQAIGVSPQPNCNKLGYFLNEKAAEELQKNNDLTAENQQKLNELIQFWKKEETAYKTREAYPEKMAKVLPSDNWTGEPGIAFPLYRMSGTQMNYDKLLQTGIPGLKQEINSYKKRENKGSKAYRLYDNMERALELFKEICHYYADMAAKTRQKAKRSQQQELTEMENILRKIAISKPQTLREAIQLSYLYCQFSGSLNFGRIDEYLGDFLANDMEKGRLDEESAIELIGDYWKMISYRNRMFDSRIIMGGRERRNKKNADLFSLYAMKAMKRVQTTTPQMSFRFSPSEDPDYMNSRLMEEALNTIEAGTTYPMLYNDDVNIPAVEYAFQLPYKEAAQYTPFGCGEYIIFHKSVGTPSGVINLLQALLVTLHNGIDPKTGKRMGLALGKPSDFKTFDQLFKAYKKQVEHYVEQLAYQEELEYRKAAEDNPYLYFSMLYNDCLERGKPIFEGGVRYLGGTLEAYGNTNTSDSLVAIKELVYKQRQFSLEEMVSILDANFKGHDQARKKMLQAPKYGNDNPIADQLRVEVDRHVCTTTREMRKKTNLHSYLIVIINNQANTIMGRHTAASPDGRKAWTYMANGNAPSPGMDQNGLTAMLNSRVKPNPKLHAGAVHNLKFSKSMFTEHRAKLKAALKTYFEMGGQQAMINVINKGDLKAAMENPEEYQNLVVRVGGFTAKFVDLPKDVQMEVLNRTIY